MRGDEAALLREVQRRSAVGDGASPAEVAAEMGMHPKRCLLLCQGWWGRRWLELSGGRGRAVFTDGRLTAAGLRAVAEER